MHFRASSRNASRDLPVSMLIEKLFLDGSKWWKVRLRMQRSYPQRAHAPPASSTRIRLIFCLRRVTASPTHRLHRHFFDPSLSVTW